ncbi:MAG: hypothetical protein M1419_06885, partial [Bacteroidetes bacterium]|nr:hypothetical protein [Bacteroidota bacterium]
MAEKVNETDNLLIMTGKEFRFIRRKLKQSQNDFYFKGKKLGASTISVWEREDNGNKLMNPVFLFEWIEGDAAPIQPVNEFVRVLTILRQEYQMEQ